jgi:hypothetical protein
MPGNPALLVQQRRRSARLGPKRLLGLQSSARGARSKPKTARAMVEPCSACGPAAGLTATAVRGQRARREAAVATAVAAASPAAAAHAAAPLAARLGAAGRPAGFAQARQPARLACRQRTRLLWLSATPHGGVRAAATSADRQVSTAVAAGTFTHTQAAESLSTPSRATTATVAATVAAEGVAEPAAAGAASPTASLATTPPAAASVAATKPTAPSQPSPAQLGATQSGAS